MKSGLDINTKNKPGTPLVISFADHSLLPLLFGDFDRNLARIEQSLGVRLSSRGNKISVSGSSESAGVAEIALKSLYRRLERGLQVDAAEVDAAIRMANMEAMKVVADGSGGAPEIRTPKRLVTPRSAGQVEYMRALEDSELVFGLGPAGTGKTYLAVATAAHMLISGKVDRIILSRPAVEAGERLGFLPGDLREKIDPYLAPLYDALYDMLPADHVMNRLNAGEIEVAPLAFMRGRTLSHAYVILDEAQNATRVQMKMFLTRLGEGSHMAITGDPSQVDLPPGTGPGLLHAVKTLEPIDGVRVVRFTDADVVRHSLVTKIVQAYDKDEQRQKSRDKEPDRK